MQYPMSCNSSFVKVLMSRLSVYAAVAVLYCTVLYCTVLQWLDRMCGITPTSKRGQIVYMFIMLLIPLIPIFALITQNMLLLNNIIVRKADIISSDQSVLKSDETAKLIRWVATLVWCFFNILVWTRENFLYKL